MCFQIENILTANKNSVVLIGGELNLSVIDWKTKWHYLPSVPLGERWFITLKQYVISN